MSQASPDTIPLSVGEIARTLGWHPRRVARWLDGIALRDPSAVVRIKGRRVVTLASLRRVMPDVARRFPRAEEVAHMAEELEEQKNEIRQLAGDARDAREFRRLANAWMKRIESRVTALERGKAAGG